MPAVKQMSSHPSKDFDLASFLCLASHPNRTIKQPQTGRTRFWRNI